jgi:Peptidase C13 family
MEPLVPGVLRDLVTNLASGARLALMLPVGRDDFRRSRDQAVLVIGVWFSTILVIDYVSVDSVREFNSYAVGYFAALLLSVLLGTYLVARIQQASHSCTALVTYIMSASPISWIAGYVIYASGAYDAIITTDDAAWTYFYAFVAWDLIVALRALRIEYILRPARAMAVLAIYGACTVTPLFELQDERFWYTASEDEPSEEIDIEQTYYSQPSLMTQATEWLEPQRAGIVDLYFLGVAGAETPDVFLNDVRLAADLFDSRFDTRGRSAVLANNAKTLHLLPLANAHNLEAMLAEIGKRMDPAEDILFLFLSSHGIVDEMQTEFYPLGQRNLSAAELKRLLDRAGIKWRVIVLSACRSGSFIKELKDDQSLIIADARFDRDSFGASENDRLGYFPQAFFDVSLRSELSFTAAFKSAVTQVSQREQREGKTPSEPQIYEGARIGTQLRQLEDRLRSPGAQAAVNGTGPAAPASGL